MKTLILLLPLFLLNSCVFEDPFEPDAKLPADPAATGLWREVVGDAKREPNRMRVLQHSDNEWLVQYPLGENTMFFRAFPIELAGGRYVQVQLIGTADGPVKPADRKYHLLKVKTGDDTLEIMTIVPEVLGKDLQGTRALREALERVKDDPELFGDPIRFTRD